MAINEVMGLTLDISANTDKFVKDLQKAAGDIDLSFNPKNLVKQFARSQRDIQKILTGTVADAASAGFAKTNIQGLTRKMSKVGDQIAQSNKKMFELSLEMGRKGIGIESKMRLKALHDEEKERLKLLDKRFKKEMKSTDRLMSRRKDAMLDAAKTVEKIHLKGATAVGKAGEDFGKGIATAFDSLKSGDIASVLKSLGKVSEAGGKKMAEKAQKGGKGTGPLAGLGKTLAKIGPALAAIGAIAAGIGALIAIVISADSAMKGLNKTMMTAGVSGADLANEYGILGDTMDRIRNTFVGAFTFNQIWGTTSKDHLEILGAYAGAGLTFKEMTAGVKNAGEEMDRLREYTEAALTYSKLLGLSTQEISATMASYMEELGFTLEGVKTRFSNIVSAAKESGFATKRFFNMVLQATSGMSMYNVRLEEAAGLLIQLGSILGEKMGGDFLSSLTKGKKDESTQQRVKSAMTTGIPYLLKIAKKDAINSGEEFQKKIEEFGKENSKGQKAFLKALAGVGVKIGTDGKGMSSEDMMKKLSELGSKDRSKLLARAEAGKNKPMIRMLANMINKSAAFTKGGGLGAAQAASQHVGPGAELLLRLSQMRKVLKGKRADQVDLRDHKTRMALETATGKSGEAALQEYEVGQRYQGHNLVAKEEQAKIRKMAKTDMVKAGEMADEFNMKFGEAFGMVLNAEGDRIKLERDASGRAVLDPELYDKGGKKMEDTFEDLVMTAGDDFKQEEETKVEEDLLLAQEIAQNTTDMAMILERGIEVVLGKIFNAIVYIQSLLGKETFSDEEKRNKGLAQGLINDMMAENSIQMRKQSGAIKKLERESRSASDERKKEIAEEIAGRTEAKEKLGSKSRVLRGTARGIGRMGAEFAHKFRNEDEDDLTAEDMLKVGVATPEARKVLAEESKDKQLVSGAYKASMDEMARSYKEQTDDWNENWFSWEGKEAGRVAVQRGERASDQRYSKAAEGFGLTGAIRGATQSDWWGGSSDSDIAANVAGTGRLKSAEDTVGEKFFIGENRKVVNLDKLRLTKEQRMAEEAADHIIEGIEKIEKEGQIRELASIMARSGVAGTAPQLIERAKALLQRGSVGTLKLDEKVIDEKGKERRLGDILRPYAGVAGAAAIEKKIGLTEKVEEEEKIKADVEPRPETEGDFFAVYRGGRRVAATQFSGSDELQVSGRDHRGKNSRGKGGGGGGGGGRTIIINSFGNSSEVIRGIQAAFAAGVL